jgi:hypothetical protein
MPCSKRAPALGQLDGRALIQKLHLPSGDFTALISPDYFNEFCLPILQREMAHVDHNVYHVDGPGVANHLDTIIAQPEVTAIQWVQGVAEDRPIMQWVPLIKKVQNAGVSIIVDLQPHELEPFMDVVDPKGIYIWVAVDDEDEQLAVIKRLEKWTMQGNNTNCRGRACPCQIRYGISANRMPTARPCRTA